MEYVYICFTSYILMTTQPYTTEVLTSGFYRVSVKWLIKNEKWQIMLLEESDGTWDFPWWGRDHGETLDQALRREIDEELWVWVTSYSEQPVAVWTVDRKVFWRLIMMYDMVLDSHEVTMWDDAHEWLSMKWRDPSDIYSGVCKLHGVAQGILMSEKIFD